MEHRLVLYAVAIAGLAACAPSSHTAHEAPAPTVPDAPTPVAHDALPVAPIVHEAPRSRRIIVGRASWYGSFHHGRPTANGDRFDMYALTAAHRTLRLGTRVRVTNLANGKSVVVRVNDRGPYIKGRILDLSRGAAAVLGAVDAGVFPVQITVLD